MDKHTDLLVIGAGISGLAFASTYLGVHPDARLLIVESEKVVGGTWNRRRHYDYFYTQWSAGFGEFADCPMTPPPAEDQFWGLFKSKHTTAYLEKYAESQTFNGRSLKDRISFSTQVRSARKQHDGWEVEMENLDNSQQQKIITYKLVVASGLTSIPNTPPIKGSNTFLGPIIHNLDFGSSSVLADPTIKHVTVLGGGKSGADMAYACVKAGKEVAWIVRSTGTGPCTFVEANGKAGFNNAFELASTRAAEAIQPSCFASKTWWTDFLHRSRFGQFLSAKLWDSTNTQAIASADYANRPSRGEYAHLTPHTPIFWRNNAAGIVNHKDFYEVIAGSVDSYYDELAELRGRDVHLESGRSFHTNALLLGTGWQHSLAYLSPSLRAELGLPYPLSTESQLDQGQIAVSRDWVQRQQKADDDVLVQYPVLAKPPEHKRSPITDSPYRLYNLVVPVDDPTRSFAAIGMLGTTNYFRTGEAQSLWVTAYFDGKLNLPPVEERKSEVALFVAWCRRRYLSSGNDGNSINFDTLRYTDRLYSQLGLTSHLQSGWAFLFSPNRAQDYAGLRREFMHRYGNSQNNKEEQIKGD